MNIFYGSVIHRIDFKKCVNSIESPTLEFFFLFENSILRIILNKIDDKFNKLIKYSEK